MNHRSLDYIISYSTKKKKEKKRKRILIDPDLENYL